jgi:all-trans-retinol 13,14-reductase
LKGKIFMPSLFDAIVVGSGLGGLTAGALFARTGGKVLLLERNTTFGGAATTFRHGALIVEASRHETTPPDAPGGFNGKVFQALDLEADFEFLTADNLREIRCPLIGDPFELPHGPNVVEARLVEGFPYQDKKIRSLPRQVWRSQKAME